MLGRSPKNEKANDISNRNWIDLFHLPFRSCRFGESVLTAKPVDEALGVYCRVICLTFLEVNIHLMSLGEV